MRAGDTEVDDDGAGWFVRCCGGDEHVGGLEVAVNHAALVRVLNGLADGDEEVERAASGELAGRGGEGETDDEVHDDDGA